MIRQQINDFYTRYAREQKLTYDEAVRRLNTREAQEWRKTVAEYLAEIEAEEDKDIREKLEADYRARSYASRITRLEALTAEIQMETNRLAVKCEKQMREEFGAQLLDSYDRKMFDIQSRAGYASSYIGLDPKMIEDAVNYPWSGAGFSERLWQNKEVLGFSLQSILTKGLISGTSGAQMSKQLSDALGASFKNAERLVRTETTRIHTEADMRAYEAAGVREYEYMCGLDEATCEVCGALDGKHFPIKDAAPGKNYPPMHPNCRCTTIEYDPEDAADWAAAGEPMPENQTYEEWKSKQDKEHGEGYVDRERQKAYNAAGDQKQCEEMRQMLGKDAPKNFGAFQKLKYNDKEQYGLYNLDAKRRKDLKRHPEKLLPGAQNAVVADAKMTDYLFNPDNKRGWAKGSLIMTRLGYSQESYKEFQKDLMHRATQYPVKHMGNNGYGDKYEQNIVIYGKTGNPTNMVVGWFRDENGTHLTSAYIKEVKHGKGKDS